MEEIYPPESYGASNHFNLNGYFEKLGEIFLSEIFSRVYPENEHNKTEYLLAIKALMDVELTYDDLNHLSQACSIDHLTCDNEDTKTFPINLPDSINSNSKLPSSVIEVDSHILKVNKTLNDLEVQNTTNFYNKRNYHKSIIFSASSTPPDLRPGCEIVISIIVYRPTAFKFYTGRNISENLKFHQEILALGRNTLAELKDAVVCCSDFGLCKEVESTNVDLEPLADARISYPSGFFFIDDVFYNFCDTNSINYSEPIIEWAQGKSFGSFQKNNMENVLIRDLTPRFGYPYLYMHQGDCEHIFVFSNAKLLNTSDSLHARCYPHTLRFNQNLRKMCFMCSVSSAKWICVGSDRLPQHKVFLCTDCCNAYNYVDGKKLGNFKLYPFYQQHMIYRE